MKKVPQNDILMYMLRSKYAQIFQKNIENRFIVLRYHFATTDNPLGCLISVPPCSFFFKKFSNPVALIRTSRLLSVQLCESNS